MTKKIIFCLFLMLILIGCSNELSVHIEVTDGLEIRIIENSIHNELESLYDATYGQDGRSISLINRITGEVKEKFEFEANQYLGSSLQRQENYYILILFTGDETQIASGIVTEAPFSSDLFILDENFNVVEVFTITEEDGEILSWLLQDSNSISKLNGEWFIYFSNHNWTLSTVIASFYAYNLNTRELNMIAEMEDSNFLVGSSFVKPTMNQLVFMASHFIEEIVSHVEIRVIDLENYELNILYSTDIFNTTWINISNEYVLLSEGWADENLLKSEVVFINLLTSEVRNISLAGYQGVSPRLTTDGQLMFTIKTDWLDINRPTRVRLYDVKTGRIVFEHMLLDEDSLNENEGIISLSFSNIGENLYIISAEIGVYDDRDFILTWARTEYIVVEIMVTEDE